MKTDEKMSTFDRGILVVAKMFIEQIKIGVLDSRYYDNCEELNDFMFKYGHYLYSNDIRSYAILLGFLEQLKKFNPARKIYCSKDLFKNSAINN